jgi:hypothetical protein
MDEPITLQQHEDNSISRAADLSNQIKQMTKDGKMTTVADGTPVNIFHSGLGGGGAVGAGMGAGLGAGVLGGVLGGALMGRRGLFGGDGVDGVVAPVVTPAFLSSELNRIQENQNATIAASERLNMARFDADAQRSIEAAIERTAAATQLAQAVGNAAIGVEVAKNAGELNTQAALNAAALGVQVQKTAGDTQTQIATQTAALGVQAEKTAAANALATAMALKDSVIIADAHHASTASHIAESKYALSNAIKADGDLTRALIIKNNDDELNRRLVIQANEITELRNEGRRRADNDGLRLEINNVNTAVASQAQAQAMQQQQQQLNVLNQLATGINTLVSQNQVVHNGIVNLGSMIASGNPTSANTRVM